MPILIGNNQVAKIVGWGAFGAGCLLLHNAYEARGAPVPWFGRIFTFW